MPGFTLIYQQNGLSDSVKSRAERLVDATFKIEFISRTNKFMLLFRDGNHYPYEIIETDQYIAIVEGKIYDFPDTIDINFRSHLQLIFNSENPYEELEYFHELDGEFIIYLLDKKGDRYLVINDFLGRLPVYVYRGNQFILSRDIYVLDKITTGITFEEQSIYEFLRLGYSLGNHTLYQDIKRFPSSSLLLIQGKSIDIESAPINLSELEGSYTSPKPEEALYEIFKDALKRRIEHEKSVVLSLSGGLDSRVLMGEIVKEKYAVDYATFYYENAIIENDNEVVRQLAKHYEKSPQYFNLKEWVPELFDELTLVKGGMNYLGMSFILDFLKKVDVSHSLMLTGDGGDKTLPYLYPLVKPRNKKLSEVILKSNRIASANNIDDYVIFEVADREKELKRYLNSIEGKSANMKYKHFLIFERAFNWLFEGEDRNRNYIWSTTPFYNPEFFRLVHSIPEKEKKNFSLFRKFTDLVDPKLNNIANANWGFPLGDAKKLNRMLWRQKLKSRIPFRLKRFEQQTDMQIELGSYVSELLHKGFGGQMLINADRYELSVANSETLFNLLTLLKVSEMTWKEI